ncbi:MAG: hypothetical protein ACXVH1_23615 [Solirubrobacteraceae bacterium]
MSSQRSSFSCSPDGFLRRPRRLDLIAETVRAQVIVKLMLELLELALFGLGGLSDRLCLAHSSG